ncbi:hypothetical protein AIOL_003988 [Candidatus Rhodobacter oscarellae]|uniref:CsgH-like domain-containing protein n=1 Tax=Candidatus Rhodobacter oscarellae TaxID=1675527 RepID=A0A0J9E8E8_9RHOB|nr:curli-like amyloid fiber formation chaperone CsgH [Candidatus Rhodobacter lobularis]KMW59007.1 hypothetical protein AIOL_003988 [Candidatus Rhodobacter lobularis]
MAKTFAFLPLAAAAAAVFVATGGTQAHHVDDLPLTCEIAVTDGAFGPQYQGLVHATETVHGSYEMQFAKHGANTANVTQSGNFSVRAGDTAVLGQASMGRRAEVEATLTLRFDGIKMICATDPQFDL